jgi:hypothetical protein
MDASRLVVEVESPLTHASLHVVSAPQLAMHTSAALQALSPAQVLH